MPRFAPLLLALGLTTAISAHAATLSWPSPASCNGSLAECIAAAQAGDTVQLVTDGPIDEDVSIGKPMRLVAAEGFAPRFSSGRSVRALMSIVGSGSVEIEGLIVDEGDISVRIYAGDAYVRLHRNTVRTRVGDYWGGALVISPWGAGAIEYEISQNLIELRAGDGIDAIGVSGNSAPGGSVQGRISENRIRANTTQDTGIEVWTESDYSRHLIHANRVEGGFGTGIRAFGFGPSDVQVVGNLVYAHSNKTVESCLHVVDFEDGLLNIDAINNTLTGCWAGLYVSGGSTTSGTGTIANNIVAWNQYGLFMQGLMESQLVNHHNLLWANPLTDGGIVLGPGTLFSDPGFVDRDRGDLRLALNSPAVSAADAGALSNLETPLALARVDALGRRRWLGALDMGALEHGDLFAVHRGDSANSGGAETVISDPVVTAAGFRTSIVGATRDPGSYPALSNPNPTTLAFMAGDYRVRNENGATMPVPSGHALFAPSPGWGSFNHFSTAENVSGFATVIDAAGLNNEPDRFVLVTPVSGLDPFLHPVAPAYLFGSWAVFTLDNTFFPEGRTLNIYVQDPSLSAFTWRKSEAGGAATRIHHPLFEGDSCVQAVVGHGYSTLNPNPIELDFRRSDRSWWIRNRNGAAMPEGAAFYVLVDEAATMACAREHIFHDGVHPEGDV